MNVPAARKPHIFIVSDSEAVRKALTLSAPFITALASGSETAVQADKSGIGEDAVSAVTPAGTVYLPLAELVDLDKERERLQKEEERLLGEIRRSDGLPRKWRKKKQNVKNTPACWLRSGSICPGCSRKRSKKEERQMTAKRSQKIGVLDSGVGGLTVVRAMQQLLP